MLARGLVAQGVTMANLEQVYQALRPLLAQHATVLVVTHDEPEQLYLDTAFLQQNKKPLFFGAVQLKKNYVSYHLMPIYLAPELLDGISAALRARMQGKSCFNFKTVEPELLAELATLTATGLAYYQQQGYLG
jgi:hypothetical protein